MALLFFNRIKIPGKGFRSGHWSGAGGDGHRLLNKKKRWRREVHRGQPLLLYRRVKAREKGGGRPNGVYFHEIYYTRRLLKEKETGRREERDEKKRWSAPIPAWRLQGLEETSELLPGLLIGAKLEVLGGQFETQRVGSQRVNHVLVAFPTVLHEERTPVGLGRADQLQALQRSNVNKVINSPKITGEDF